MNPSLLTQSRVFFLPQAREHLLFPAGACLWKAVSLWLVEKTRHPSSERPGICSAHSIPVYVLIQLCSVAGQALTSNFSDAGIRGVPAVVETFYPGPGRAFSVVGGSEQASSQGEGRTGKILAGLEDMLHQERRSRSSGQRLSQHPSLVRHPAPTHIGCLVLGHWAVASTAEWLRGSREAASPLPSGSKCP